MSDWMQITMNNPADIEVYRGDEITLYLIILNILIKLWKLYWNREGCSLSYMSVVTLII